MFDNNYYKKCLIELKNKIPVEEYNSVMSQQTCELDSSFLGFINVYKGLTKIIPKECIVIDFGCNLAAQSYFFKDFKKYIGVDTVKERRFNPTNCTHYICSIQEFVESELDGLFDGKENLDFFAICSYVPDENATELVRKTFKNVFCFYPN